MDEERIIDLGEDPGDFEDFADEAEWQPLRQGTVARLRLFGIAILALVCVAAFGGAAPPPAPALTYLGDITWPRGMVRDGPPPTIAAGLVMGETNGEVLAYHPNGQLAWRAGLDLAAREGVRVNSVYAWEGSILHVQSALLIAPGGARPASATSVALNPATGREKWRIEGRPERVGNLFMVVSDRPDGQRDRRVYRSLPDGLLWTVPPTRMGLADPATDSLMTLTDEGLFTEYQLSTGQVRRTAQLEVPHLTPPEDEQTMGLLRDRVMLRALKISGPQLAVKALTYDRATLRPLESSPLDGYLSVSQCGPVLCASTFDRTSILDPDSHTELWHTDLGGFPTWTPSGLLLTTQTVRVVDELTGHDLMDLDGWTAVYEPRPFYLPWDTLPTLVTRQMGARTYIARLTTSGIRVLGAVQRGLTGCRYGDGLLVCHVGGDLSGVWRLNAPN